jgi:hypothetical protein
MARVNHFDGCIDVFKNPPSFCNVDFQAGVGNPATMQYSRGDGDLNLL